MTGVRQSERLQPQQQPSLNPCCPLLHLLRLPLRLHLALCTSPAALYRSTSEDVQRRLDQLQAGDWLLSNETRRIITRLPRHPDYNRYLRALGHINVDPHLRVQAKARPYFYGRSNEMADDRPYLLWPPVLPQHMEMQ